VKRFPWRGLLGLALTIFFLWLAFRHTNWGQVWTDFRQTNLPLALVAVTCITMIFPLRARRWRPILHPVAPDLPFGPLWRATAIGMMANNLLPLRIGELVRAYALSKEDTQPRVPFSAGFASLFVDRVFDAVIVLVLMVGAMFAPGFPRDAIVAGKPASAWAIGGATLAAVVAGGLYAIVFFPKQFEALFAAIVRRMSPRLAERGVAMMESFANGLGVLRQPRLFLSILFWALLLWLAQGIGFYIMFFAVGIDAPFSAALFIQGLIVLGVALPSSPGYFGPYEIAAIAGLSLYGVSHETAVAWALTLHILSLLPITIIGLYYMARSGTKLAQLRELHA
jgi:uncharacterized protein (TIRG00374 family)